MSPADDASRDQIPPRTELPDFASKLVLVVGVGRSGTTALHLALGHHPELIDALSEAPLERSIAGAHGRVITRSPEYLTYVKRHTKVPWKDVRLNYRRLIFEAAFGAPYGTPLLRRREESRGDVGQATRWVAKVGGISPKALAGFDDLFEDFRTVGIHRNGIDTVASRTKFYGFSSKSFEENCRAWTEGAKTQRTLQAHSDATLVRHDQLLDSPESLFTTIFAGLDLADHPGPAEHSRSSITNPTQAVDGEGSVEEHFATRAPAHEQWTEQEKQIFVETCGPAMSELGYEIPF